jgi:hypothetical protein
MRHISFGNNPICRLPDVDCHGLAIARDEASNIIGFVLRKSAAAPRADEQRKAPSTFSVSLASAFPLGAPRVHHRFRK